ncbi:MAG: hypothetical protein HY200_04950 [Nitrospirae bacterium]|nr:hypothetical protein [Nitrospirota bacterium]MBI3594286.1 hypothetical protein [Nitrospirota bacterium]
MYVKDWWPLFPLLFLIVLLCLIAALIRLYRSGHGNRIEWIGLQGALLFYFLTFAVGRWRWLHAPISHIAEVFILFNILYFFNVGKTRIAWLNLSALLAIGADFALHHILK